LVDVASPSQQINPQLKENILNSMEKCEHLICKEFEYNGELHYVCQDCRETQRITKKDGSVVIL